MALTQKYSIMCDEVRQENNGKFLVIGMYVDAITVPQLPATLPSLTFFNWLLVDRLGAYTLRVKIESAETGRVLAQAPLLIDIGQAPKLPANTFIMPRFANVTFETAGGYTFTVTVEGDAEPVVLMPFDVLLIKRGQPRPQPQRQL